MLQRAFGEGSSTFGRSPIPILFKHNGLLTYTDGSSVYTVSPSGGDGSRIRGLPNGAWHVAWSPDGSRLALSVFPAAGPRQLWVADADGSNAVKLAEADNISQPGWYPDGSMIVYAADTSSGSTIHVVRADGTDDRVVGEELRGPDYFSAAFSPDGTRILFDKGTDSGFGIFSMDADGTDMVRLSEGNQDYDPAWSPDGTRIAFTRQEVGPESDIFVMDADGSNVKQLTDGPFGDTNLYPTWAPDGASIAYVSGKQGGSGGLVVVRPNGDDPHTIVEDGVLGLAWQPEPVEEPSPTSSAKPTPSHSPEPAGRDIGLGSNLCDVESLSGIDFLGDGVEGKAWTGTKVLDDGTCPTAHDDRYGVAVDFTGDGVADSWSGETMPYCVDCRPFRGVDLNLDGREDLIVTLQFGSQIEYGVYTIRDGSGGHVGPVVVGRPGHKDAGFVVGEPFTFWVGSDETSYWFSCDSLPDFWLTHVSRRSMATDADIIVRETNVSMGDGIAHILDAHSFTVAAGTEIDLQYATTEPDCGLGLDVWRLQTPS